MRKIVSENNKISQNVLSKERLRQFKIMNRDQILSRLERQVQQCQSVKELRNSKILTIRKPKSARSGISKSKKGKDHKEMMESDIVIPLNRRLR